MAKLVYFSGDDGVHGEELWVTDGTPSGTRMVKDINPDNAATGEGLTPGSDPSRVGDLGDGRVVFGASDVPEGHHELWITDGTAEGTVLLRDLSSERWESSPEYFQTLRPGVVVFVADLANPYDDELWVTDGTFDGTTLLKDIYPAAPQFGSWTGSNIASIDAFEVLANGRAVFLARDEQGIETDSSGAIIGSGADVNVWTTDGTADGTFRLIAGNFGETGAYYTDVWPLESGKAFVFFKNGDWQSAEYGLGTTDGTIAGTAQIRDATDSAILDAQNVRFVDGKVRVSATEFQYPAEAKPNAQDHIIYVDSGILFDRSQPAATGGNELVTFLTDGTAQGTRPFLPPQIPNPPSDPTTPSGPSDWSYQQIQEYLGPIGDGLHLVSASFTIGKLRDDDRPVTAQTYVMAITDGTTEGTRPIIDDFGNLGVDGRDLPVGTERYSNHIELPTFTSQSDVSRWVNFFLLSDGRYVFEGQNYDDERKLYVTDGNGISVYLEAEDLDIDRWNYQFENGNAFFSANVNGQYQTFLGTPSGPRFISDGAMGTGPFVRAQTLASGLEVFWVRDLATPNKHDVWISNGTAAGTYLFKSNTDNGQFGEVVEFGTNQVIAEFVDGDASSLWILGTSGSSHQKLADISARNFQEVSTGDTDVDAPVSTLFPIRLSLEEQPNAFDLDDYFTDPGGDTLAYQVTGLPADIALNPTTNEISTSAITQSGTHKIEVTATNDEGTAVTSTFDWSIVDSGKLKIVSTGEWVSDVQTKQISSTAGSVITLGHKDGVHGLLRIEGEAGKPGAVTIEKGNLIVKGKVFSDQVSTTKPIMEGEFTINMATLAVSKFKDDKKSDDHRLVDGLIDMQFADLSIYRDKVSFKSDLLFDGTTGGKAPAFAALSTKGAPLAATFGAGGIDIGLSVGTQQWAPEPLTLNLGTASNLTLGFSKMGADYDAASDSLYISGKASLDWGGELENGFDFIDNDSAQSLTIDLAGNIQPGNYFQRGDKYLKLSPGASGGWDWDVVGEIKYEDKNKGPLGPQDLGVKELKVTFDTIKDQYVGSFKAGIPALFPSPFSTTNDILASLGFLTNPAVRLDSFSLGLDGLNVPVGATGVFLQGGTVAMQGLGTLDPKAPYTYQADVSGSLGPNTDALPSPIRGKITGQIKLPEIEASVQLESKVGYFVPNYVNGFAAPLIDYFGVTPSDVTNFVLFDLKAQTKIDVVKGDFSIGGNIQLIGGAVTGQGLVRNFTDATTPTQKNLVASLGGTFKMPDAFPVIGGLERSGNALLTYSPDGDGRNDFVAAWTKISIPLLFTTKVYSFGAQYNFDGTYKVLGNNTIPKTSSWTLDPNVELVILSAEWDTASTTARLEVIAPDGSVLTEADIAARDDMAIVTDLGSPTSRHVAIYQPDAGVWDLRVADSTGLGNVTYVANEMLAGAAAEFVSVTPTPADHSAAVQIATTLGDATTAQVTLFASEDTDQLGGIDLGQYTVTAGNTGFTHDIDYGRLGPGTWYLYARTEADGLAPDVQMYGTPLSVSGAADLNLGMTQNIDPTTDAPVITFDIVNNGDRPSNAGVLVITVPDTMTGASPVPGFNAVPLNAPQSEVPLPILAPGESITFSYALPVGADVSEATIGADIFTTGTDADMSDNKVAYILEDTTNETIVGTPNADSFFGGTGNDSINGLAGVDTARYSGPQISYTLSLSASGDITLTDRRANGDGTDLLENVERLDFDREIAILNGQPLDLTVFGGPTRLFPDDFESFIELYIAYFNRAPDAIGLNFWGTAFSKGTTLSEMATLFIDQPETRATYPTGLSNADFATAVYDNVLGRIPDQAGFDFWVGALNSQAVGRDQFILAVLDGAKASPPIGASQDFIDQQLADRAFLATKTDIGAYFAVLKGMSNVDNASAAMALYDGTNAGLTNAVNTIDAFYESALDPVSGEFLMPLVGVLDDPFAAL